MKTKIRTTFIICALAFVGINVNAANYRNEANSMNFSNSGSTAYLLNEDAEATIDFRVEAQMISKWVADQAEARAIQKLVEEGLWYNAEGNGIDSSVSSTEAESRKEANTVTKSIADNEEAKVIQKLVDEGKLAEIW